MITTFESFRTTKMFYHGTTYNFDKFSLDYAHKGEGANAFGYGVYITEDKRIAKYYAYTVNAKVSMDKAYTLIKNSPLVKYFNRNNIKNLMVQYILGRFQMRQILIDEIISYENPSNKYVYDDEGEETTERKLTIKKVTEYVDTLKLAEIPKSVIYKLYFIKKPILIQWEGIVSTDIWNLLKESPEHITGAEFYKGLVSELGSDKNASYHLKQHGIDGIEYATNSLNKTTNQDWDNSDKKNYVIFDENLLNIVGKL